MASSEAQPIARREVEVSLPNASSYHVTFEEAKLLTANGDAKWISSRKVMRHQDFNIKGSWIPTQSGRNGPLVLQFQT